MIKSNWRQDMPTMEAYWMNKVLYDVHHLPHHLERYKADPAAYLADSPMSEQGKAAIRDNDVGAMYLAGVNPYLLRGHCLGLHLPEQYFLQSLRDVAGVAQGAHHG